MDLASSVLPFLVVMICLYSLYHKQNAYQSFMDGVKQGLHIFMEIYPSMLSMLFAITLLRESGFLTDISYLLSKWISGLPASIWPLILFRPISGSASLAILIDLFKTYGADSFEGILASVIQGSTDTTLYVLTLYFGSIQITHTKNALWIGLLADVAGITMAILLVLFFLT